MKTDPFSPNRGDALRPSAILRWTIGAYVLAFAAQIAFADPLPGTQPLKKSGDLSTEMVAGIGHYLDREIAKASATRLEKWQARDATDPEPMRRLLRQRLGMNDTPVS